jgi:hypothetical protein
MWPCDSDKARVAGVLEDFEPAAKRAAARCESAYPGMVLRRQVQLWRHCVVDRCEALPAIGDGAAAATAEHQFDYVLHLDGSFEAGSVTLRPRAEPLGTKCGYQFLERVRSAQVDRPAQLTFRAAENRLRLWVLPRETAVELILADGPTNAPDERKPMVIVRRHGPRGRFLTVCEPLGQEPLDEAALLHAVP